MRLPVRTELYSATGRYCKIIDADEQMVLSSLLVDVGGFIVLSLNSHEAMKAVCNEAIRVEACHCNGEHVCLLHLAKAALALASGS